MKINRKDFLKLLKVSGIGLTKHEVLEQSNCYVFHEGQLITFNDEILTRVKSPLDFDAIIPVADFGRVLAKFPDEEVDVSSKGTELIIKGKRRSAGIASLTEVLLPFSAVPEPLKWRKIRQGVPNMLQQAARTCGRDQSNPITTLVHVTKMRVEACDNFRLFRCDLKTGFPGDVLIPGTSLLPLEGLTLVKVSIGEGWAHFQTDSGHEISCRCSHSKYANVDPILKIKSSETVILPSNLGEMVGRAEIMATKEGSPLVKIKIEDKLLVITSRKDGGWYKERKRIKYEGPALAFETHPKFLAEVLERTRKVKVGDGKMKLEVDDIQFVVCLEV